jgi:vitamin B12 transporter
MFHSPKKSTLSIALIALFTCLELFTAGKALAKTIDNTSDVEIIEVLNEHDFSSSNYQVLRREDFIDSSQSLSDILGQVNGIQIRQISGVGNPVSISIRGSSAKQVQFFIDGQLVNDSQFGSFDLNQIPTEQIESIEISKNQAIGTGSTPIGGVIRINTYNPSDDTNKVSFSLGSFGYQELSLLKNTAFKHHSLAFGGTYLASDNDYDYLVPQSFYNPSESITEPLKNNTFEKISLFINDSAQINQHQLRVNVTYNKQSKGLANYQNNSPENRSNIEMDSLRYGFQYNWLSNIDYLDTIELEFYNDTKDEFYLDSPNESQQNTNDYQTDKLHLGIKPSFTFSNFTFSPFASATKQIFTSFSSQNGKPNECNGISACDIEATQEQVNLGVRLSWESGYLPLSSYLLANRLHEDSSNVALNQVAAIKEQSNTQYHTQEFGFSYGDKKLKTSFNWSKGVRTPTLYELFGDRGAFKGNDNLLPEEADTYALSIKYQETISLISFNASSAIYQQSIANSIVAIFNSSGTGSYTNVSNAELLGLELQAGSQITSDLSFSLQAHLIDSTTESEYVAFNNKKLPGIYHQQYSAAVSYQLDDAWSIKISTNMDKELYFNRSNQFETNDKENKTGNPANRVVTDLSLHWRIKNYSANLSFSNLFDEHYQDLANRPAQGRSIQLKLSIEDI